MKDKVILVVDDEVNILELLKYNLESNGYIVLQTETGEEALSIIEHKKIDMAILDLMLPGIDGLEILKYIRNKKDICKLPIIMLTAKSGEIDKVVGLELGADDYISKPFGVYELLARVKSLFRRTNYDNIVNVDKNNNTLVLAEDISMNKETYQVFKEDNLIEMTLKEFELLYILIKNRGRVFSREYLLDKVWGYDYIGETRTVDVHINNIRKKIEDDVKNPQYIITLRGVGYKFSSKEV